MGRDPADGGRAGPQKPPHDRRRRRDRRGSAQPGSPRWSRNSAPTVDAEVADAIATILGWAPGFWRAVVIGALVFGLVTVGEILLRRRWTLARDLLLAGHRPRHDGGRPRPPRRFAVVGNRRPSALGLGLPRAPSRVRRSRRHGRRARARSSRRACSEVGSSRSPRSVRWCSTSARRRTCSPASRSDSVPEPSCGWPSAPRQGCRRQRGCAPRSNRSASTRAT